jgi:hypothetical protein
MLWGRVDLVRTDDSEERAAFTFKVKILRAKKIVSSLLTVWRPHVAPKRRFLQDLHGATSQKTASYVLNNLVDEIFKFYSRNVAVAAVLHFPYRVESR